MFSAIVRCWPLFFGLALIGLGIGMQGSLLGIRASLENFDALNTGMVMAGYYVGYFAGSLYCPSIIVRVGHIRTFGALASLASAAVLVHAVFVNPWVWAAMRFITGFSVIGIYLVAESWLNAQATNQSRGSILSFYMLVVLLGFGAGQFLLNLGDPASFELFICISLLVSLALIPILLSATRAPDFHAPSAIGIKKLYRLAPLGVVGSLLVNCCYAMIFGMGAVYATDIGLSVREVALFMGTLICSGALWQWPLGKLSDRVDRRIIISSCSLLAALFAGIGALGGSEEIGSLFIIAAFFGGLVLPLYSMCAAHANDFVSSDQTVAANATLMLIGGLGAVAGPLITGLAMYFLGPPGFFWSLVLPCGGIGIFAAWRIGQRPPAPFEERSKYALRSPMLIGILLEDNIEGENSRTNRANLTPEGEILNPDPLP